MSRLTIVTDGSPFAAALARWLDAPDATLIEARDRGDVATVIEARRRARIVERVVTLAPPPSGGDVAGDQALAVATEWLAGRSPIDVRSTGARVIGEQVDANATGADVVQALASATVGRAARVARRGRPAGANPFRGASLEVAVALLLDPEREHTERALAAQIGRSPYAVHRAFSELSRRGYLARGRAGSRVRDPIVLRDDVVVAWRGRVSVTREAAAFLSKDRRSAAADLARAARKLHREVRLAGPSAVTGPTAPAGGPLVMYLEGDPVEVMKAAGFHATTAGDVVVWPIVEAAILLAPREIRGIPATNRVITYADLMVVPNDRAADAAGEVWRAA